MSTKSHWDKIYEEKSPNEVSWTQEIPVTSIKFFERFNIDRSSPIIDIGGGESKFVDYLIKNEYKNKFIEAYGEDGLSRRHKQFLVGQTILWPGPTTDSPTSITTLALDLLTVAVSPQWTTS